MSICVLHLWIYSGNIYALIQVLGMSKNADWHQQFSWTGGKDVSNKYSQSYGFEGYFIKIVEACIYDIISSRGLMVCPKHRDGEFINSIAKLYVRWCLYYYFKFKAKKLFMAKTKKVGRLKLISSNENRLILKRILWIWHV